MGDPWEGLDPAGMIRTGARTDRIPPWCRPLLDDVVEAVRSADADASVYVYGSVATGMVAERGSDVDLLTVGLDATVAARIAASMSARSADRHRGVEVAAARPDDLVGDSDAAYGMRVFVHHYCVHLAGPDVDVATGPFAGDRRAARGLNGDVARRAARWREESGVADPRVLGRRVARKTLLAVAGLVSIHDHDWTTDRERAARRWGEIDPGRAGGLEELLAWSTGSAAASRTTLERQLTGTVDAVVARFADDIGLWSAPHRG